MHGTISAFCLCLIFAGAPIEDTVLVQTEGQLTLRCNTRWHNLNMKLKAEKSFRVPEAGLIQLRPPELGEGVKWTVTGKGLAPLARALHQVQWTANATDNPAYQKWLGSMVRQGTINTDGKLALKLTKTKKGWQASVMGKIEIDDRGNLGNRFGPNSWQKKWTHAVRGRLELDSTGSTVKLELTDKIQVSGGYFNGAPNISDPFTKTGTLDVLFVAPKPLAKEDALKVEKLVNQLTSPKFVIRERAAQELRKMGPGIASLLREIGASHKDPEVRQRLQQILNQWR